MLVSGRSDPVLAQWQYGLGRSVAWTSDATGRWAKSWVGWDGFSRFFGQLVAWTFPGEESGGIEASFVAGPGGTTLRVESVGPDGSPRDFYATSVVMVDPALEQRRVDLAQVAPGVYEAPIGELTTGAYALRVTQTLAGAAAVGRTLGLVAPSPAEYRLLGTNEPLLAAIRDATGGRPVATAEDVWLHDLGTTAGETPLWPLLLVLALLLWPLDVFLRRVQVTRRDLAAAGAWVRGVPARRGRVATRPAPVEGMLAARDRAGGEAARAAIRREGAAIPRPTGGGAAAARPTPAAPPAALARVAALGRDRQRAGRHAGAGSGMPSGGPSASSAAPRGPVDQPRGQSRRAALRFESPRARAYNGPRVLGGPRPATGPRDRR